MNYYGWQTLEQKKALTYLFQRAGILGKDQPFEELFPLTENPNVLLKQIVNFLELTQERFAIGVGKKERWQVKEPEWMAKDASEILDSVKILGFSEEVKPTTEDSDAICILGATMRTMQKRCKYVKTLIERSVMPKCIILLSGERGVTIGVDGTEEELQALAKDYGIAFDDLTETHLMKRAFKLEMPFCKIPLHAIHTPRFDLTRPTTETTIEKLVSWLKNHSDIKKIIFVSNQPHVLYQSAIIKEVLRALKSSLVFEVCGPKATSDVVSKTFIGEIGRYIWAKTPCVLSVIGGGLLEKPLKEKLYSFYCKNPVMRENIENSISEKFAENHLE